MNVAQHVERGRTQHPDRTAIRYEGSSLSYAALDRQAGRLAGALSRLGVRPGDRVALYLPNCPEFVVAYLAIQKLAAIAVSLSSFWKRAEVSFALTDCGAKVVVTDRELEPNVEPHVLPELETVLLSDALSALLIATDEWPTAVDVADGTPSAIVYSSGTTGQPKGCTLSHGNVVSNMRAKVEYLDIAPYDRLLLFVPLFHCFGQNAVLNAALEAGATVVLERGFGVEPVLNIVKTEAPTMFFGPPPVYSILVDRAHPDDLAQVRYFFSAAAPLPVSVSVRWQEKFGRPIHEGYGLTETSPFASYNHRTKFRFGSVGTPIHGVDMKVVDPETSVERGCRQVGEIVVRGPNVMLGYWGRPEETAEAIRDGWFHTGDLGYQDDEGYFYLVDRLKDIINVGGFKVSPAEVEQVLLTHSAVAGVGVLGLPDPVLGEQVAACVVLTPGTVITDAEIMNFCRERLAGYKTPVKVQFVPSLPSSPTGKMLRRELRRLVADR